jgi:hypothetical protein
MTDRAEPPIDSPIGRLLRCARGVELGPCNVQSATQSLCLAFSVDEDCRRDRSAATVVSRSTVFFFATCLV